MDGINVNLNPSDIGSACVNDSATSDRIDLTQLVEQHDPDKSDKVLDNGVLNTVANDLAISRAELDQMLFGES